MSAAANATGARLSAARDGRVLAVAAALAALVVIVHGITARGLIGAGFAVVLVVLSAIDLEHGIIPNRIVLPATAALFAAQVACFPDQAAEWALAALGAAAFLALPLLWVREGVGMGDIKLALFLGAGLGLAVVDGLFYGALAACAMALVLVRRHGRDARRMSFPFGPFLALGGIVAYLTGHHLV